MDRLEELVRDSLRNRAQDVEPTPALWQEVERKVARHRRFRVLTWSLAGVTAAAVVGVGAPLLLAGDPAIDIADAPVTQAGPEVPHQVVMLAFDGDLSLLDLRDGGSAPLGELADPALAADVVALEVPSDERAERPTPVVARALPDGRPGIVVERMGQEGATGFSSREGIAGGGMVTSPDGAWFASLATPPEADGAILTLTAIDGTDREVQVAVVAADAVLQDWQRDDDGLETVLVRNPGGTVTSFELDRQGDAPPVARGDGEPSDLDPVLALSVSHTGRGYVLADRGGSRVVEVLADDAEGALGRIEVTELVSDLPDHLWLDAWGDAVLLGDGAFTWLLAHDGDGNFLEPRRLPDGVIRAALVGRDLPGAEPTEEPVPTDEPGPDPTPAPVVGDVPLPLVQAEGRALWLKQPGEPDRPLLELAGEGESWIREVAVRPGSTPEDLTVVVLTTAEGFHDLRHVRVVGGQVLPPQVIEDPAHRPAASMDSDVTVEGLAWSPDGTTLAWLERDLDGIGTTLRTIGWDDGPGTGDPASDNASFEAGALDGTAAALVDWIDAGEGRSVLRFTHPDSTVWWRWVVERQPDGAIAVPAGSEPVEVPGPDAGAAVAALGGADDEGRPTWMLVFDFDGGRLLADPYGQARSLPVPEDLPPGDGLPYAWLRPAGDGVLVGGSGRAWYVAPDGAPTILGDGLAAPIR